MKKKNQADITTSPPPPSLSPQKIKTIQADMRTDTDGFYLSFDLYGNENSLNLSIGCATIYLYLISDIIWMNEW